MVSLFEYYYKIKHREDDNGENQKKQKEIHDSILSQDDDPGRVQ